MEKIKNEKGFTLTEIIICIALIGLISLIVIPSFGKSYEDFKAVQGSQYESELLVAADAYLNLSKNNYLYEQVMNNNTIILNFSDLENEGLVNKQAKSFFLDENINLDKIKIIVTCDENKLFNYKITYN